MSEHPIKRRVVKIGGSLLQTDQLAEKLLAWLAEQPPAETLAIVGGGKLIDVVRELDAKHSLAPKRVHWQCVDLLRVTFQWLATQLPTWKTISNRQQFSERLEAPRSDTAAGMLLAVDSFYYPGLSCPLPESWDTTTDAIAGWLAIETKADELILLKSCDSDTTNVSELARQGIVDPALPLISDRLPMTQLVNFNRLAESAVTSGPALSLFDPEHP
jgi:aspartokinase-like uncharacterized kinase